MNLSCSIEVRVGEFDLALELEAAAGETVAVLGPNGAGKTTLLRCLAGLTEIDRGHIRLGGRALDEPAADAWVDPQDRAVGFVFQQHLLFPAKSVLDNVAFGLRARGASWAEARRRATDVLGAVGLADRGRDRPHQLSGGQSQRVALARAMAIDPQMLLLDEPLAALDVTTRAEIRRELRRHLDGLDGCVRLLVSHDPVDAFALADRVVVLEAGQVTQSGLLHDVAARPTTSYVADLVGVNLYSGDGTGESVALADGTELAVAETTSGPVFAVIHPRAVSLHTTEPAGSPRNRWEGTVSSIDLERDRARVRVAGSPDMTAEITARSVAELGLRPGDAVWVSVKATEIATHAR